MELRLQVVEGCQMPVGSYVAVKLGDVLKQGRYEPMRAYQFPSVDKRRYAKIDVFKHVGTSAVMVNPDDMENVSEISVTSSDPTFENLRLKVEMKNNAVNAPKKNTGPAGPPMATAMRSQAQDYLSKHGIEEKMSGCIRKLLQEKPDDPIDFVCTYLRPLSPRAPLASAHALDVSGQSKVEASAQTSLPILDDDNRKKDKKEDNKDKEDDKDDKKETKENKNKTEKNSDTGEMDQLRQKFSQALVEAADDGRLENALRQPEQDVGSKQESVAKERRDSTESKSKRVEYARRRYTANDDDSIIFKPKQFMDELRTRSRDALVSTSNSLLYAAQDFAQNPKEALGTRFLESFALRDRARIALEEAGRSRKLMLAAQDMVKADLVEDPSGQCKASVDKEQEKLATTRRLAAEALRAAAVSGSLELALGQETLVDLRQKTGQVLMGAALDGSLARALDQDKENRTEGLREQARQGLLTAGGNGSLQAFSSQQEDLRTRTKEALKADFAPKLSPDDARQWSKACVAQIFRRSLERLSVTHPAVAESYRPLWSPPSMCTWSKKNRSDWRGGRRPET
jgi:hypothetical protein